MDRPSGPLGTIVVQAAGLAKRYGPIVAVDDVSFELRSGEILGFLGPNGAGKSTTLRMLIGFQYPDAGTVLLRGRDIFRQGSLARASLGYLPEQLPLYTDLSVREYLNYFARLKRVPSVAAAVDRVVERCDLGAVVQRACGNLSRGYRQRVGLAQALLADPELLILDEPTSGLDPNQIHDFREMVRALGRERAVLLSTHVLPEAMELCDRVLVLHRGRVVASGSPRDIGAHEAGAHSALLRSDEPPSADLSARFGLVAEGRSGVFRVTRDLDADDARALLAVIVEKRWELLEWQTGASGLEAAFRRLTLGEEAA